MNRNIALLFPLSCSIIVIDQLSIYNAGRLRSISLYFPIQIMIIFLMMISILLTGNIRFKLTKTILWLIGFICFASLSILFSIDMNVSLLKVFYLVRLSFMSFLIFLFLKKFWILDLNKTFMKIMCWVGVVIATFPFISLLSIGTKTRYGVLSYEVNHSAGMISILFPFALYQLIEMQKRHNLLKGVIYNICCIFIIIAVLVTGSRMGVLIISLNIFLVIILQRHYLVKPNLIIFNIILIFLVILLIRYGLFKEILEDLLRRFYILWNYIFRKNEIGISSVSIRNNLLYACWQIFLKNPLFGIGLGNANFSNIRDISLMTGRQGVAPHNTYIEFLSEIGIFGFIFFILILLQIGKNLYFFYRTLRNSLYLYLTISFLNLCLVFLLLSQSTNHYFWGFFLPLSMYLDFKKQQWELSNKVE